MKRLTKFTSSLPVIFIPALHHMINPSYLDPGTGSIIIQALLGGLVGAMVIMKTTRDRIIFFFKNLFSRKSKGKDAEK